MDYSDTTSMDQQAVLEATQMTATSLRKMVTETAHQSDQPSHVSVPEREELIELISQILPAGNVVGFVFNGILNAKGRGTPSSEGRMYFNSLFKGLAIIRNNAFYRMMFLGPATVLVGLNMLIRLAGANPDEFLPEGAWQFYVEFGLREDAARHSNETRRFQQVVKKLRPSPSPAEELTAWVLSAMWLLRDYPYLSANLWEENVRLRVMEETTGLTNLHRSWQQISPFAAPENEATLSLPAYRHQQFERFCSEQLNSVGAQQQRKFSQIWNDPEQQQKRKQAIHAYQQQLSIRTYLEPGEYSEKRVPIRASNLQVGVIHQGGYYLIPVIDPSNPTAPALVHSQVEAILRARSVEAQLDLALTTSPRAAQAQLRKRLSREQQRDIENLQQAPILINWDQRDSSLPLCEIRETHRGINDHAITLFHTQNSMVFDFSHIYFDGPWAMQVAEMLTNEAIRHLHMQKALKTKLSHEIKLTTLKLDSNSHLERAIKKSPLVFNFISAEARTSIAPVNALRSTLADRTKPSIRITVNDLLVLYRTIFNQRYTPGPQLTRTLNDMHKKVQNRILVKALDEMFAGLTETNPSLMILIDASRFEPRERLFPSTFRSPFLDFRQEHDHMLELLHALNGKLFRKGQAREAFSTARGDYISTLSVFGEVMRRYRAIAIEGESMSTTAIRLIAGLPGAMQRLMDGLPGHFAFMNEAIKGEEVFSNVGRVTPGSSITRFASAKDDNDKKVLVWSIMTDDNDTLCLALRDFRPPILALAAEGQPQMAQLITQDFVDRFLEGFMTFIGEVNAIITASGNK
ncbi:MAG: choline/carnitine O-acyltransferase [Anaerolineaceae bacterium]|nr:choline/carnitine O-acyltransferase [Anaerolineaceae bacterium]